MRWSHVDCKWLGSIKWGLNSVIHCTSIIPDRQKVLQKNPEKWLVCLFFVLIWLYCYYLNVKDSDPQAFATAIIPSNTQPIIIQKQFFSEFQEEIHLLTHSQAMMASVGPCCPGRTIISQSSWSEFSIASNMAAEYPLNDHQFCSFFLSSRVIKCFQSSVDTFDLIVMLWIPDIPLQCQTVCSHHG